MVAHTTRIKDKTSTDVEKASDKIQQPLTIRTLDKVEIEGNFLNFIRTSIENSQIILTNRKEQIHFPSKSRKSKRYSLLLLLFNIVLNFQPEQFVKKKK